MIRKTVRMMILLIFVILFIFSIALLIGATKLSGWDQIQDILRSLVVLIIAVGGIITSYSGIKKIKGTNNIFKGLTK